MLLVLFLALLLHVVLGVAPAGVPGRLEAEDSLLQDGRGHHSLRRSATTGNSSAPPHVVWESLARPVEKKATCKSHHPRVNIPSALGGMAIGVLLTLPLASAAVDHLCPKPEPDSSDSSGRLPSKGPRPGTWSPALLKGETAQLDSLNYFWPRCASLTATLLIQSISSIILAYFNTLIAAHPSIILFLTTIVGLGGNAGGQSTVLTVRRLALGQSASVAEQAMVGVLLSLIVGPLLLARTLVQGAALKTSLTIVFSSIAITVVATTLGCGIPKFLWKLSIDPAHGSSFIQVVMDILGILIVCLFGVIVLS